MSIARVLPRGTNWSTALMRLLLVATTLALFASVQASAETALPDQAGWVAARQSLTTPDGLEMSYVEAGPADGLPILLLHGYTDNSRSWSLLAPHLPGRRLIMLDLRGHGGTAAPACCYGPDSMAHDVAGFMQAAGIDRADVVGHSMGSVTAAMLAATHPERVNRLVLISTTIEVPAGPADWLWANVPSLPDPIDPNSQFMLDWYYNPNPVPADFLDRERAESAATARAAWIGVLQGLAAMDLGKIAPRITAPTLILWGDQDGFFDAASQEAVRAAYAQAEFQAFPGFGHNMFWEVPDQAGARIMAFLGQ